MKKMILILTMASTFIACRNGGEKTAGEVSKETVQPVSKETPPPVVVQKEIHYVNTPPPKAHVEQKKKGWSKAAKGAAIGAGAGAITGAVVSKKKGKGAVIGGVIGAGAGYVIGRNEDKKDGRVNKK